MNSFDDVLACIRPTKIDECLYSGNSVPQRDRIFGGQVISQCLLAANDTVDRKFSAHSLHAYFLRAGNAEEPIEFEVDPIRDGRSFVTRRVVARQQGKAIFNTSISYQIDEEGLHHDDSYPAWVRSPEQLLTEEYSEEMPARFYKRKYYNIDGLPACPPADADVRPIQANWFRADTFTSHDPRDHQAALALISDFSLLGSGIRAQGMYDQYQEFMTASIDHALWFHAPIKADDWLLYLCESPWAGNGRSYGRGKLWSRDGQLLASACQEGLMRKLRKE